MKLTREEDRRMLEHLPEERTLDLYFLQIRNIWRVDGLYFLGIEAEIDTEAAAKIDAKCWEIMGKIEAKQLRGILKIDEVTPESLIYLLRNTSWALDILEKEIETAEQKAIFRVTKCGTQLTRLKKGLEVFPCKAVRFGYLKSFAEELNPCIDTICRICPPDRRPRGLWCEWEFRFPNEKERR